MTAFPPGIYILAFGILCLIARTYYKFYKQVAEEDRPRLKILALSIILASVILVVGIRVLDIPDKLFNNWENLVPVIKAK